MILTKADIRSIKNTLLKLNGFLDAANVDIDRFDRTISRFEKRFDSKIGVIDFEYFDEQRLTKVRRQILKNEKMQNLGYLQNLIRLERLCSSYIELRKLFNFDQSTFLYEDNFLLYCHFGTSKNDPQILRRILQSERYIKLNIKT